MIYMNKLNCGLAQFNIMYTSMDIELMNVHFKEFLLLCI